MDVLSTRIESIEKDMDDLKDIQKRVQLTLEGVIRLEERHIETKAALERAFKAIEKLDGRVQKLEIEQPMTKAIRTLTFSFIVGISGLVLVGVFNFVFKP